jgi:hypothetical protein
VTIHLIFHFIFFLGGSSFVGHAGLSAFTGGRIIHGFSLFLSPSFHFSHFFSTGLSVGLSVDLSTGLSFGLLSGLSAFTPGLPSFFLLNVLENHGNPTTSHCFQASTGSVHACPAIVFVISIAACVNLDVAS